MSHENHFPDLDALRSTGAVQADWHQQAFELARSRFGSEVFVRGVVEVSNYCREDCAYCGMRRSNRTLSRYRARLDQITELILHHRPQSITDINIQSGEDPVSVREIVLPLIETIRRETSLGISVCLGTLDIEVYARLRSAGAALYIMKFEIADAVRYAALQAPGNQPERLAHIEHLAAAGWGVSSGFIAGLPGLGGEELAASFRLANRLPLDGCSVSPFVPGDETPFRQAAAADLDLTLNCMAGLRLMRPDWIIPAVSALNLLGSSEGYARGLRAGANLVTINLTPEEIRGDYLLYKRERFIMSEDRVLTAIDEAGLKPSVESLTAFVSNRRRPASISPHSTR